MAKVNASNIEIEINKNQKPIGNAHLLTDNIDLSYITAIHLDDDFVNHKINDEHTIGEIFFKFSMKFPTMVKKSEYFFILETPDNLKNIISKHQFDRG